MNSLMHFSQSHSEGSKDEQEMEILMRIGKEAGAVNKRCWREEAMG